MKLLTVFCKASNQSNDHRQQISGLRALETLSSKNYFVQGTISIEKLEVVLEAVIQNFQPQLSPATTEPRMGDASIVDQLITVEDLMLISQQCLQGIFRNTNASTLKQLFELSLKIIDKKNGFEDCALFISILKGILSASPAQYHFTVVKSLWDRLDIETREVSSTTLVSGLRSLMSIRSLAGMTVPELLDNSFKQLEKIIEAGCTAENTTRVALVEAIGSLAIHTAYPNQVNEIFGYLLNKAELWYSAKESANPLMMISILESMESVLNRRSDPEERRSSVQPSLLPYELVQPLIKFFQVSNITIKSRLLDVLRIFLKMGMEYKHTPARTEVFIHLYLVFRQHSSCHVHFNSIEIGWTWRLCNCICLALQHRYLAIIHGTFSLITHVISIANQGI